MLSLPPLYPITDARLELPLAEQVRRLGEAGFPLVQFRGKPLDLEAQWRELRRALAMARENGGWPRICVNDRADLAVLAAQEGLAPWGLHLGQTDLPPSEARRLPGLAGLHLGTSTHGPTEWTNVDRACDHAGLGPFRATATKGDHAPPIGLEGLRAGCAALRAAGLAPIAIGGLTPDDARGCFQAGAESLAMVGAIARAPDAGELLWVAQTERWRACPPIKRGQGVVLAGGSGAGKTALARALAPRLGLVAVDLDGRVEERVGRSIAEIFADQGETVFRRLETQALLESLAHPCVLALGGGAWETPALREGVQRAGFAALWVAEVPATAWSRVGGDPARPLAQDRKSFMARWRGRAEAWSALPPLLPLGRSPEALAQALTSALIS